MGWDELVNSVISAAVASGIVLAGFRFYFEKRIEHSFDRKLAEHEARLAERSQLRVAYGTERLDGYRELVAQIRRVNRRCRDRLDSPEAMDGDVSQLLAEVARFEEVLYTNAIALEHDQLYEDVHAWKNLMQSVAKRLDNASRLDATDPERATAVRASVAEQAPQAMADGEAVVGRLNELIRSFA